MLLSPDFVCKVADFESAYNLGYSGWTNAFIFKELVPPECCGDISKFTTKGDVYFYGWILIEMVLMKEPKYNREDLVQLPKLLENEQDVYRLIFRCIDNVSVKQKLASFIDLILL